MVSPPVAKVLYRTAGRLEAEPEREQEPVPAKRRKKKKKTKDEKAPEAAGRTATRPVYVLEPTPAAGTGTARLCCFHWAYSPTRQGWWLGTAPGAPRR
jgi:hypothetical protein